MSTFGDVLSTLGMFSRLEDIMSHLERCRECIGECLVHWKIS